MGRILVTYDSRYGATTAAAETITETIIKEGLNVDLRRVGIADLSRCDVAIVGSPIRLGRCTPRIKRFLTKNLTALASIQVAFFFTCMSVTNNGLKIKFPMYIDPAFYNPNKPDARIGAMKNNHNRLDNLLVEHRKHASDCRLN